MLLRFVLACIACPHNSDKYNLTFILSIIHRRNAHTKKSVWQSLAEGRAESLFGESEITNYRTAALVMYGYGVWFSLQYIYVA